MPEFREGQALPVGTMVTEESKPLKALVVADNQDILQLLTAILNHDNFSLITATSNEEGLRHARSEPPDVIIVLAGKNDDGVELCRQVRADSALKETPLVVLTTCGNQETYAQFFTIGCDQILPVPFKCSHLYELVQRATNGSRHHREDRIRVLHRSGQTEFVSATELNQLLANKDLLCFQRNDGVASIGHDPIRCFARADYRGPERRNQAS